MAAGEDGCSKGAIAIEKKGATECTTIAEEGSDGIERETTTGRVQFVAGCDHGSWQQKVGYRANLAATCSYLGMSAIEEAKG
ncbi:hypothetical protein GW17_00028873 [Ensete ventricosum]|nr:hypothetical protein GW17_00028873 [Ensete ventricosum]RZS08866.1 hypothetical protein BHM03_00039881 [Ensete ventricosum]